MFMLMCKLSCADVYIHMYMYASIRSYAYVYIHIHVHTYSYVYVDSCDVHTLQHEFMKTHLQHVQSFGQLVGGNRLEIAGGCLRLLYHLLHVLT